jgi:GTP-binding protein
MLVDSAVIFVSSGKGGDGVVAFRREKFIPKGGPTGGNGGRGGDVYLRAMPGVDTLLDMTGRHHWGAQDGEAGRAKSQTGADGKDLIIDLPPGTLVFDDDTGELIVDLDTPGKTLLICKGGAGGLGNEHFKHALNQAPRTCTLGEPAQQRTLRLELKLIADIGFVGKPNAGKSTLLSRLSKARPKIADYPFTTLEPQLGIAELSNHRRLVLADLPGLIEGAAEGAGLGHEFLRHIERTRIIVHVIEIEPTDESDPIDNYHIIRRELERYSPILAQKPQIIALNKLDLLETDLDRRTAVQMIEAELGQSVLPISGVSGAGLSDLLEKCWVIARSDEIAPA